MLTTRFEDYTDLKSILPFTFAEDIHRTKNTCGTEANWHENLEVQICTKGEGYVLLDGNKFKIKKGDTIIVNSQVMHYTGTDTELNYACLIIDSDFCKQSDIDHTSLTFQALFYDNDFLSVYDKFREIFNDTKNICHIAKLKRELLNILINLRENHTVNLSPKTIQNDTFKTVQGAIKYIRDNYGKKIYIEDITNMLLINKYSLSHEFKKITGQTLVSYLNSYRCKKASEFIQEGKNVSEAAMLCGFNNMSFFTKVFKKYSGSLPSEYKI